MDLLNHKLGAMNLCSPAEYLQPFTLTREYFLAGESYMTWSLSPQPDFVQCIRAAQNRFSVHTNIAYQVGAVTPAQRFGAMGFFDENKRYNMFEHLTNLGAMIYFHLEIGDIWSARYYMDKALESLFQSATEKIIPREYGDSFRHVFGLLCLYAAQLGVTGRLDLFSEFRFMYANTPTFDSLSSQAKAGVYGIKQFYWKMIRSDLDLTLALIRQAISLDPGYYEWHYCLQATLRSKRRKHSYHHFQPHPLPDEEEKVAIIECNQLAPEHPRCMLAEILYLADILKAEINSNEPESRKQEHFEHNNMTFKDMTSLVAYIKERAWDIIEKSPTSVHINTTIAEIFTLLLPHKYRDSGIAKECLDRSLSNHPFSAKANHRMGTYLLNKATPESVTESTKYFLRAITSDDSHYPSLCALIQVLFRDIRNAKKRKEFDILIKDNLERQCWDTVQQAGLLYFGGLSYLATKKTVVAVNWLKKAHALCEGSLTFVDLPYQHRRYLWPKDSNITLEEIRCQLYTVLRKIDKSKIEFVHVLISKIREAIDADRKFQAERSMHRKK